MNLREMGAIFDEDVPECVLDEPLEQHFMHGRFAGIQTCRAGFLV